MTRNEEAGRDPRYWWRVILRHKWPLLAIVVVIPVAVCVISLLLPKTYEASTTLQVRATSVSSTAVTSPLTVSTSSAADATRLIETTLVAERAAKELGEPASAAPALVNKVDAQLEPTVGPPTPGGTAFVTITARAAEADRAADIANAFATAVATQRAGDAVKSINQTIASLEADADQVAAEGKAAREVLAEQLQTLRALRASQDRTTTVVEPALPPAAAASPHPVRNTALALVCSLLLAAGLVPFIARLDRRFHETDEIEEVAQAPLLGEVPEEAFLGGFPSAPVREAFQTLRAGLTYFNVDRALESILVASPTHQDGKTTVATYLATALAQDGRNVILVDADLRRHQAAKRAGVDAVVGLGQVLLDEAKLDDALVDADVQGGRLRVLASVSHPPNPAVLLGSDRMRLLLAELSERSDIVVIDTPPLLAVSDAVPLLKQASGVVLVSRVGYTTFDALSRARQIISTAGGTILGAVATGIRVSRRGYGYGYLDKIDEQPPPSGNGADGRGSLGRILRRGPSPAEAQQPEPKGN